MANVRRSSARPSVPHVEIEAAPLRFRRQAETPVAGPCDAWKGMDPSKEASRRWYKARQQELRELLWEWDPLGLMGAPDDEYDSIVDGVLSALVNGRDSNAVTSALQVGLLEMAGQGYSGAAAEREMASLSAVTQRIIGWWQGAPASPATLPR